MSNKKGVFVVQSDAQAGAITRKRCGSTSQTQTSELQFSGGQREPDVEEIRDAVRPKQK